MSYALFARIWRAEMNSWRHCFIVCFDMFIHFFEMNKGVIYRVHIHNVYANVEALELTISNINTGSVN